MKSVSEAVTQILSYARVMDAQAVPVLSALNRVLREDARADLDSPPFDCSAMDGYAVRSDETGMDLEIVGPVPAGTAKEFLLQPGQCARIFTGARIPSGTSFVLMQEHASVENGRLRTPSPPAQDNIRRRGENCRKGDVVVKSGSVLSGTDLAALVTCGITNPLVSSRPRVVHFATGDELIDPSQTPVDGQIRDSNSTLVASLLTDHGANLIHQSRLPDSLEKSAQALAFHQGYDLLLISGGASVGDHDFTRSLLENAGFEILLHGINMRPGKPLIFGVRGNQLAFGLPGNPVSHAVIFHLILAPLLSAMAGATDSPGIFQGYMEKEFSFRPNPRETFWPCRVEWRDRAFRLHPLRFRSSGDVLGIAGANGLLRIPSDHDCIIEIDEALDFIWLQHGL